MVKNLLASAVAALIGTFYLVVPSQEAEAPSFGPNPTSQRSLSGIEKLISENQNPFNLNQAKNAIRKLQSTLTRYDFVASKNPFFADIYSVWADKGTSRWSPEELYSIFWVESGGDLRANSHSYPEPALGPFQIIESSWNSVPPYIKYYPNVYKMKPSTEKAINLLNSMYRQAEVLYPNWNKLTLNEQKKIVFRTYNAGIGRYQEANWIVDNLPKETQNYVPKIIHQMIKNNFDTDSFLSKRNTKKVVTS